MISKIKITSGYAAELPIGKALSATKLAPGLNILWGANGSGKTSVLKIAAAFTFCHTGGWSRLLEPMEISTALKTSEIKLPGSLVKNSPGGCKAILTWDKTPVFFANSADQSRNTSLEGMADDGMTSALHEILHGKMSPKSSGETRRFKLAQTMRLLEHAPDFKNIQVRKDVNSTWEACFKTQAAFLAGRPDKGRVTILMDEPEKHLDLKTAREFWEKVIPHLSKFAQVIVATHHPFALTHTEANWVCGEAGENATALKTYQNVFSKIPT